MTRRHAELPRTILIAGDVVAAVTAALVAYWLRFESGLLAVEGRTLPDRYLQGFPIAVGAMIAAVALAGLYRRERLSRGPSFADGLLVSLFAAPLLGTLALFYWKEFQYSRLGLLMAAAVFGCLFVLLRFATCHVVVRLRRDGRFRIPAAVIGGGRPAAALAAALSRNAWMGVDVIAVVTHGEPCAGWEHAERLAGLEELCERVRRGEVREVYVALPAAQANELGATLQALAQETADVRVIPDFGRATLVNPSASVLAGLPVVSVRERPLYGARALLKRSVDMALAVVLLLGLTPLMVVVAALVRLTSNGPVLFGQTRMGLGGEPFEMLKFRTMSPDAERDTGPVWTQQGDDRVTPLGRVLRRLSLDELPQLWNVVRGEMSLVGPRPERPPFIEEFRRKFPGYMLRHSVKAGMTGWAQVNGLRGETSLEERLRYDLEYIDRWSLLFDLEILGRTAVQVLIGRNAY
jgi:exopolysaccharide biosynthesis polyprenyl glycosylphosphotransferase